MITIIIPEWMIWPIAIVILLYTISLLCDILIYILERKLKRLKKELIHNIQQNNTRNNKLKIKQ